MLIGQGQARSTDKIWTSDACVVLMDKAMADEVFPDDDLNTSVVTSANQPSVKRTNRILNSSAVKDESHNKLIGSQGRAIVITFFSFPEQSTDCIASKNIISFTKGDLFMCIGSEVVGDLFTGVLLRGWLLDPGS